MRDFEPAFDSSRDKLANEKEWQSQLIEEMSRVVSSVIKPITDKPARTVGWLFL